MYLGCFYRSTLTNDAIAIAVLFVAQVHISWPYLGRPSDDPEAVGLNSLKLETSWFSACDIVENRQRADSVRVGDCGNDDLGVDGTKQSIEGAGVPTPKQWDDMKVMEFIQVCRFSSIKLFGLGHVTPL